MLEVDGDLAVVQVLEGTDGLALDGTRVVVRGRAAARPGRRRLARAGSATAAASRSTAARRSSARRPRRSPGCPLNPAARGEPPAEPVLTGISAIDALTTLVRGQKLPIFSVGRAAAPRARHPDRGAGHRGEASRSASSSPAMGLTHADAAAVRDALEERSAAGELVLLLNTADDPVIERIADAAASR